MAKRILRVELEIEVCDLSKDERKRHAGEMGCKVSEVPSVGTMDAYEVANVLEGIAYDSVNEMLFEGSDVYAVFARCAVSKPRWSKP